MLQRRLHLAIHAGASFIGVDGKQFNFKGVNWFGFETDATMCDGLYAGTTELTQDFAYVIWRMKLLGFNAVRLPFSFQACVSRLFEAVFACWGDGEDLLYTPKPSQG